MSDISECIDISPSRLAQVAACEKKKLRDTVTDISALHMSLQEMDGRSPSPRSSFKHAGHDQEKEGYAVIKGLPSSSKLADITNDLAEIGFQIDSCTQLTSINVPKNPSPIFL
ncbi:hypothetical protein TNCV_245301 [Trichonephila clavipes]|nr:hypothetical protein TNCV_245301 [Trichonephila clavipes]